MSGYQILFDGRAIECGTCGRVSHNQNDVKHQYCGYCHKYHEDNDPLHMWTVYERPTDYPDGFAARRFVIGNGMHQKTDQCIFGATLESVRWALSQLSPGMTRLPRDERDEPQIIETWM